jgi:chaperone modulatory protein CbpM
MIMESHEFILRERIDAKVLDEWVEAGLLAPHQNGAGRRFSEVDLARAQLIRDLQHLGVNDEGIPVVLDLVDQLHGLRRVLRELLSGIYSQPEAARRRLIADLHQAMSEQTHGTPRRTQTGKGGETQSN